MVNFVAQVPEQEPAHPVDVYPLIIQRGDFCVGGASWLRHRQKFPNARLSDLVDARWKPMCAKREALFDFFLIFDRSELAKRRRQQHRSHPTPSEGSNTSRFSFEESKEEPIDDDAAILEHRGYYFFYRSPGGDA